MLKSRRNLHLKALDNTFMYMSERKTDSDGLPYYELLTPGDNVVATLYQKGWSTPITSLNKIFFENLHKELWESV